MKDLIISCSDTYTWTQLKCWVSSINASGFAGDKVLIVMNCDAETAARVRDAGFELVCLTKDGDGHCTHTSDIAVVVERFALYHQFLSSRHYRYVITTDVKDVVFQRNPSDYLEKHLGNKHLIFSSESICYKDEPWGNANLASTFCGYVYEHMKQKEIFNAGVLAGRSHAIRDLSLLLFSGAMDRRIHNSDQAYMNLLLSMSPFQETSLFVRSEDGWAAQLGTTADPSKIESFRPVLLEPSPQLVNGEVLTSKGIPFTIVHQYDRVPEWKAAIEAKFDRSA